MNYFPVIVFGFIVVIILLILLKPSRKLKAQNRQSNQHLIHYDIAGTDKHGWGNPYAQYYQHKLNASNNDPIQYFSLDPEPIKVDHNLYNPSVIPYKDLFKN